MGSSAAFALAGIFVALAGFHLYWRSGGRGVAAGVPTIDGRAAFEPTPRDLCRPFCESEPPLKTPGAEAIVWLLSDEASYPTGAILDVAGGR